MPSTFMTGTSEDLTKALKAKVFMHQSFQCILWFQIEPPSNVVPSDFLFFCVLFGTTDWSLSQLLATTLISNVLYVTF